MIPFYYTRYYFYVVQYSGYIIVLCDTVYM